MGLLGVNKKLLIVGGCSNHDTTGQCEMFDIDKCDTDTEKVRKLSFSKGCSGIKLIRVPMSYELARQFLHSSTDVPLSPQTLNFDDSEKE